MKALRSLLACTLAVASVASASSEINVHGAVLPGDCQKVGENRYRTSEDWENLKKFYHTVYPEAQFPRKNIINQPDVKAIHIPFPPGRAVEGLNIYQANDEIRIFVVQAQVKPKKKAEPKAKKQSGT